MTRKQPTRRGPQPQLILEIDDPADLVRLYEPDVSLLWWRQDPLPDAAEVLQRELFSWAKEVGAQGEGLEELEPLVGSAAVMARARTLVELQASLFEVEQVGVRVALTQSPLCPSFHLNRLHCRILTTLAGEGTQWTLGPLYNVSETSVVQQLPPGAVGWFKGTAWEGVRPLVHRSPPGTARRLVLTVDLL